MDFKSFEKLNSNEINQLYDDVVESNEIIFLSGCGTAHLGVRCENGYYNHRYDGCNYGSVGYCWFGCGPTEAEICGYSCGYTCRR